MTMVAISLIMISKLKKCLPNHQKCSLLQAQVRRDEPVQPLHPAHRATAAEGADPLRGHLQRPLRDPHRERRPVHPHRQARRAGAALQGRYSVLPRDFTALT